MKYDTNKYRDEIEKGKYPDGALGEHIKLRMLNWCLLIDECQQTIREMEERIKDTRKKMQETANDWGV